MTATAGLARLREPFPPSQVGLLPRVTCRDCSQSSSRVCSKHAKQACDGCGNYMTGRHIHLDYVGHGAVTDRLLEVDPSWSWEPLAFDDAGMPTFIYDQKLNPIAFWIKLTVLGVTRLGVGTVDSGKADAEKQLIGDALRNAAMRFGVALDLWIKGQGEDDEQSTATDERSGPKRGDPLASTEPAASTTQIDELNQLGAAMTAEEWEQVQNWCEQQKLPGPDRLTVSQADRVLAHMRELMPSHGPPTPSPPGALTVLNEQAAYIADHAEEVAS